MVVLRVQGNMGTCRKVSREQENAAKIEREQGSIRKTGTGIVPLNPLDHQSEK